MAYVTFIALGFVSLLLQITVLRELLTVFSGNELDIGITLALWLLSVGLGSLAGSRVRRKKALGLSFLLVAVLSVPTLLAIEFIRPALGLELGEGASLGATFVSTAITLFPLCFSLGLQFPLAVSYLRAMKRQVWPVGGRMASEAAVVYGLEAAGAFLGGLLFTFVLSGRAGPQGLALSLALLYVLLSTAVLNRKSLILFACVPIAAYVAASALGDRPPGGAEVVERVQSRYGEVLLTGFRGQTNLYSAGHFLFSRPDPKAEELGVHLPMSVHPAPERILTIGGSPGRLGELAKYPVERVDFVEIDPRLMEVSLRMLDEEERRVLEDERVRIIIEDGRTFVKSLGRREYDLVLLDLSAPSTANMNRFYTVEFFGEVRKTLREGGMVALTLPASAGYVGRRMQLANGSVFNSLRLVFPQVEVSTEEYGFFFASESAIDLTPSTLARRFAQREIATEDFHAYVFEDALSPLRAGLQQRRLGKVKETNTDLRQTAYLYNLMLWAEIHGARGLNAVLGLRGYTAVLMIAAFAACAALIRRNRRRTLYYSILTTGYAAMAFTLAVVLGYQASYGYVYEMFGLLSAVFMVGVALGSYLVRSMRMRGLLLLELLTVAFAASAPLFFMAEPLFYLFSLLAGVITGCQFAAVNICMRAAEPARAGGMLYAFDLMGSFMGATLTAIIFIPLLGVGESLLIAGGLKVISASMVFLVRHE